MNRETVIVIGGGISGLVAARELSGKYDVILLEALRKFGGRICSINKQSFNSTIEGGAEFIHGDAAQTIALLKEAGIGYVPVSGEMYRKKNRSLQQQPEMIDGWEVLIRKMGEIETDITLNNFLHDYFPGTGYTELRAEARAYAEGFDIADPDRVSVKSLHLEWVNETDDYRVEGGYGKLIRYLVSACRKKGCKLINHSIVKEISWKEGSVTVSTVDHLTHHAQKCVITVPVSILQKKGGLDLSFKPALTDYFEASQHIGYGGVIKVLLSFKERFWKKDAGFFLSQEVFPTWWTQLPEKSFILTGWVGGNKAIELSKYGEGVLLEQALSSVASIFNLPVTRIKEMLLSWQVFNWQRQKSILGAYTYKTPQTLEALKILNEPVQDTLYFAGEGMYTGAHPGTVEAAIVSAQQMVTKIIG
ncbi:flavin monoamine oxidase family protein [Pedobacter metabolipauper]|uniref:Tryptophan 2-monooxygenase n=1 Tax=Pedobacter metabolipauper TaxID=425513 RepID=A0A4R6T0J1_9SPHI|nr:NAD(P)/FAD-dependent oxidoreductase [Pedobacter metabolipauper]TDQ11932.1 monoamine oxidase [Pedobacter metabolipauper]